MNKKFEGISYSASWTQPYSNWKHPTSSIDKEMAVIEAIDNIVDSMTVYPDVTQLMEKFT